MQNVYLLCQFSSGKEAMRTTCSACLTLVHFMGIGTAENMYLQGHINTKSASHRLLIQMSNLGAQALSVVTGAYINVSELAVKGHAILS